MFLIQNGKVLAIHKDNLRRVYMNPYLYYVNIRPDKMDGAYIIAKLNKEIFDTEEAAWTYLTSQQRPTNNI